MSSSLSKQHEDMPTIVKMISSFSNMLIEKDRNQKLDIINEIMNAWQSKKTPVQENDSIVSVSGGIGWEF